MLCAASCMLYRERTQPTRSAAFSIGPLARNGRTNWIVPHSPTWNKTGRVKSTLSRTEMAHTPVLTRTVSGNTFGLCHSFSGAAALQWQLLSEDLSEIRPRQQCRVR